MNKDESGRFEAWLDEENRIVSFHKIPNCRYYSAEEHDFWQMIVSLILSGYRVQECADSIDGGLLALLPAGCFLLVAEDGGKWYCGVGFFNLC